MLRESKGFPYFEGRTKSKSVYLSPAFSFHIRRTYGEFLTLLLKSSEYGSTFNTLWDFLNDVQRVVEY